jgi:hypothetical protein
MIPSEINSVPTEVYNNTFYYINCTLNSSNQIAVFTGCDVLIGCFSNTSTTLKLGISYSNIKKKTHSVDSCYVDLGCRFVEIESLLLWLRLVEVIMYVFFISYVWIFLMLANQWHVKSKFWKIISNNHHKYIVKQTSWLG